ncbi:hypothetical protein EC957_009748 [Mortierella hygrophila]|uniref:Alpha/beta hydrolase fold-3 domain-containing protein n=1 Tax=Mortierella hygrophila TaxID=979708 RepID=A0A9P6FAP9_9FUNG|nr:hypothetical protein EC957_009748 [Mortierella hygrophila]
MTFALAQNQNAVKFWTPIAYSRLIIYLTANILRTTIRKISGRTPKGQALHEGFMIQLLRIVMGGSILNVTQSRNLMNFCNSIVHLKTGTFLQSSKDKWATPVKGEGWKGFWIPFKNQVNKDQLKKDLSKKHSVADIGSECDIVMFAIHGGGMVKGDALMFLSSYRAWMKVLQQKHNLKIGVLSVEYTLSPEGPFPTALNECVAAYKYLIEHQGVDPRRVVMCGDSAGGNLCLTTALKIRDAYPGVGLPAGQVLFSPWVMCPKPLKDNPDDYITCEGGALYVEAYTQNQAKVHTSPYASPIQVATLAGMPRMQIFIGGVETLRPSIERFITKATAEGVEVESHLKEGKAHDYPLIEEISGAKVVRESHELVAKFVARIRDDYIGVVEV